MLRLFFVFFASLGLSFFLLWGTRGEASSVFSGANTVLYVLGALFGAMSFAFFNYVEGVMKDVPKKLKSQRPEKYSLVISTLTDLKREVVLNVVLVVLLLMISFVVAAIGEMGLMQRLGSTSYWVWSALSVRGACFVSILVVMFVQLSGFVIANNLRAEISMHGE
ncbi:hypothetical protein SAMN05216598_5197 [Pseudomonas asplenii]|uniref:Uncharacterized protein n=1 Tax=Pseudomonas asplenii TaxID=53407 RepID=A0A1H1ZMZ9_9PSED|nr:hypothetical protein [Pseudomonas asplenii]SDT35181.1 hypothetical protein SAMN05216598_5197 [Pseudomonas asplenii]